MTAVYQQVWDAFNKNNEQLVITLIENMTANELASQCTNTKTNRPLLHDSACQGHLDTIRYLIEQKFIPVDSIDTHGHKVTALHMACREGHEDVVQYLVQKNADINLQDRDGYSPLHYASMNGYLSIVLYLIKQPNIDVNLTDYQSRTALHRSIEHNQSRVAHELIVKAKVDVNIQNNHGWTALHYASYQENAGLCSMLLNHGADINLKDRDGHAPLFWGYGTWRDEEGGCTLLLDNETTSKMFQEYLKEIRCFEPHRFMDAVNSFILLKSANNRYRKAQEIVEEFLKMGSPTSLQISKQKIESFLESFKMSSEKECRKDLFDELYDEVYMDLKLDAFRRFTRSQAFISFMEKQLQSMGENDFVRHYLETNSKGDVRQKEQSSHRQVQTQDEEEQTGEQMANEPAPVYTTDLGVQFSQADLPEDITPAQLDSCIHEAMHPVRGVKMVAQKRSASERFFSFFAKKKANPIADKRVFSGHDLVDFMCNFFELDKNNKQNRRKMVSIGQVLIKRFVISKAKTLKRVASDSSLSSRSSLVNSTSLSDKDIKKLTTSFSDSTNEMYLFLLKKKVLILGAGFGGLFSAKDLHPHFDVTIVDKNTYSEYRPSIHTLVASPDRLAQLQVVLADQLGKKCTVIQGVAQYVTETAASIKDKDGKEMIIPFDYLIVSTGSSYAHPFPVSSKTESDEPPAKILYPYYSTDILKYIEEVKRAKNIAVIGGGPVACEFLGEVAGILQKNQQLTLISQCDVLMERLCPAAHENAFKVLSSYDNVKFLFNRRVTGITGNTIQYCFNEENETHLSSGELKADIVFCCTGFKPNTSIFKKYLPDVLSSRGYVKVNSETFQVQKSKTELPQLFVDQDTNINELKPVSSKIREGTDDLEEVDATRGTDMDEDTTQKVGRFVAELFTPPETDIEKYSLPSVPEKAEYYSNIFAVGDIVYSPEERLAYVAKGHGLAVGKIICQLETNTAVTPYKSMGYQMQVVSLGPTSAIAIKGAKVIAKGYFFIKLKSIFEYALVGDMRSV